MLGAKPSWNFVSHLFSDFGGEPVVGDFFETHFASNMSALRLNGLHQYVHS